MLPITNKCLSLLFRARDKLNLRAIWFSFAPMLVLQGKPLISVNPMREASMGLLLVDFCLK
jgi:hypothetical protein